MKHLYSSFFSCVFMLLLFRGVDTLAQTRIEKCGSSAIHDYMMQTDANYAQKMTAFENQVLTASTQMAQRTTSVTIYKIPVVVHVMHKGEPVGSGTNVSDVAIQNAIKSLNEIYRKVPGSRGDGNGVDVEIEFALAVRDPSGNCTNGIVRVDMSGNSTYMSSGVMRSTSGISDASLKATSFWNKTKYYNIWLVSEIDNNSGGTGVQGYAYFASSHGTAQDGAVMLANNFIGGTSTTCAHELGHALNLYHTFEGDGGGASCPSNPNGCGSGIGDCCSDIPAHIQSASDCVSGTNSCNGTSRDLFIHNYMDYSSDVCQNMFTANQKTRMVTALTTTRASFLTPENGGTNDALTPVSAPTADFFVSGQVLCGTGQSISLLDKSSCVANSYIPASSYPNVTYSWTVSNGTNVYTSSAQNPTITITNAGSYTVTLTVTNALGSNTVTKPNAIIVPASAPVNGCTPTSANSGNTGQTICDVQFNNINAPSATIGSAAYTDLTCTSSTTVTAGSSYPLKITALGINYAEYFEVYIDYNNNGVFTNPGELVFSGSTPANSINTFTTNVSIPTTAVQNTLLRMRVMGEANAAPTAAKRSCSGSFFVGDVEDYGVYIKPVPCSSPSITATSGASRCGSGTASVTATASAGTVNWYATSTGTTSLATGTVFTTPSLTTTTTYYVDATNSGCTTPVRTAVTVTVNTQPVVTVSPSGSAICAGQTATLTASGATTYTWLPSGSGASNVVNPSTTTVYTVTGSNGTCVSAATMATVTVNAIPVLTVSPTATTICSGSTVTLTASGASTYTWLPSGSGAINAVSPVSTTIYTVTGSNGSCNSVAKTLTVTVNAAPSLSVTPSNTTICNGSTVTLTASGAATYTWLPSGTGATKSVNPSSTTVYTVTGTSSGCVSAPKTATVTVNAVPVLTVSPTATTICSGASATLTASGATTYTWLPSGSGATNVVSPSSTSVYTVSGSNGSCNSTPATVTVTVGGSAPSISVTPTSTTLCSGASATLTASGATTYTWLPAGSGSSNVVSPSSTTIYSVSGSSGGCASAMQTVTISVTATPSTAVTASSGTLCAGQTATLTATGASNYAWLPGGQTTSAIGISPSTSTTYTVTGSNGGCSLSKTITITVNAVPTVTASLTNTTICSGTSVTVNVGGASSYTWLPSGSGSSSVLSPSATTVYSITGSNGSCAGVVRTVTINVTATPTIGVSSSSSTLCAGQSTTLTASGATSYAWQPGAQTTAAIGVTPSSSTVYTVTGSNGSCSASKTIAVTVNAIPTLSTSVTNTAVCSGTGVTVNVSGASSYTWSPTGLGSSSVLTPSATTVYSITGSNGSCVSAPKTVTVTVNNTPTLAISASSSTICSGQSATLTASGAGSYAWLPGGQTTAVVAVSPSVTTTYSLTGANGACTSSTMITVNVTATPTLVTSITNTTVCSGTPVTVSVTGAISYSWMPSGSGSMSSFTPLATTVYTVLGTYGGCTGAPKTFTIQVTPSPTLSIGTSTASLCAGQSATLTASGAGSYLWQPGSQSGASVVVTPSVTTTYSVTGTSGGCSRVASILISVSPSSSLSASVSNTTVCSGTPVTVNMTGGSSYVWTPAGSGSSSTFSPLSTTVYTVTGNAGCGSNAVTFTITVVPAPSLTASAPSTICAGATTTLSASGATNYSWLPTTGLSSATGNTVIAFPASSLTYTVTGSNGACSSTQTIPVSVVLCVGVETLSQNNPLVVFPNPSTGLFTVSSPGNTGSLAVEVMNTLGQTVLSQTSKDPETVSVDMGSYARGVYYLKVQWNDGFRLVKVILE